MEEQIKAKYFSGKVVSFVTNAFCHSKYVQGKGGIMYVDLSFGMKWKCPKGYKNEKFAVDGIPVEKLTRDGSEHADRVILQLHGGGYIAPLTDMYRKSAVKYSDLTGGGTVYNINYRVAPKHTFPAARDDAERIWTYLTEEQGIDPKRIVVVGDSAGGNLTLALTAKLRDDARPLPLALVCMSPWADLAANGRTYKEDAPHINADALFGRPRKRTYEEHKKYLVDTICSPYAGDTPRDNPELSPVYQQYHGFPQTLIVTGGAEILLADSETIAAKLEKEGVPVEFTVYAGMFHIFPLIGMSKEAKLAWQEIKVYLNSAFAKQEG